VEERAGERRFFSRCGFMEKVGGRFKPEKFYLTRALLS
jgi:hypothetical protein